MKRANTGCKEVNNQRSTGQHLEEEPSEGVVQSDLECRQGITAHPLLYPLPLLLDSPSISVQMSELYHLTSISAAVAC